MKKRLRGLWVLMTLVALIAACTRVEPDKGDDPGTEPPTPPTEEVSLIDVYYSGLYFSSGKTSADKTTLKFSGNFSATLSHENFIIHDCRDAELPSLRIDSQSKTWIVNDIPTAIPVDKSLANEDCEVVCAAYTYDRLYVYLNNSKTLIIPDNALHSLFEFKFEKALNANLPSDVKCSIDGNQVKAVLVQEISNKNLIPTFEFRGKSIKVSGSGQTSRKTSQDFSSPVEYVIDLYDGTTVSFTVSMKFGVQIPTVYLTTANKASVLKDTYRTGTIKIEDPDLLFNDVALFEATMQIKGRGNTSWDQPKKPYRIKLDEKAGLFGMPKNKDWVFMANYTDKSLMRNMVAFKVSEICEMPWTPAIFPIDLYLNGTYIGNYNFVDHKEVAKHRVDIELAGPEDNSGDALTGGYYFEIETRKDEPVCWDTDLRLPMMFKDPSYPTSQQQAYVKQYFKDTETRLENNANGRTPDNYKDYIDVMTFVNYFIVEETLKNIDGNMRKSTFMTKERNEKLKMYHVWDHDLTLGNCDYMAKDFPPASNGPTGWYIKEQGAQYYGTGWYPRLFKDPEFVAMVKARWNEVYPALLTEVPDYIDYNKALMKASADRNFQKWRILSSYVWPNQVYLGDWGKEVDWMKNFYLERIEWLNTNINAL